jgi:hypothetical protein
MLIQTLSTVKSRGCQGIAFAGVSDLDSYSESYIPDQQEKRTRPAAAFLQEVMKQGAGTGAGETPGFQGRAARRCLPISKTCI